MQVLPVVGWDDILDWDHEAGKADSAKRGYQSAVGLHHHGGSDGGQESGNMPALIWTWERRVWALFEAFLVALAGLDGV